MSTSDLATIERELLGPILEARRESRDLRERFARAHGRPPAEVGYTGRAEHSAAVGAASRLGLGYDEALERVRNAPLRYGPGGGVEGVNLSGRADDPPPPPGAGFNLWARNEGSSAWTQVASGSGRELQERRRALAAAGGRIEFLILAAGYTPGPRDKGIWAHAPSAAQVQVTTYRAH